MTASVLRATSSLLTRLVPAIVVLAVPQLPAVAQSTPWSGRLAIAEHYAVPAITQRRFTQQEFWTAITPSLASSDLRVEAVGQSMQGRPLRTITFGHGPVKVLLWSQMHGDEATATMALADIFNFLASATDDPLRERLDRQLTITFLPMLNPDGAELFQRENAAGIDINRDVRRLASSEARTLKAVRDRIIPDFGFNLHDQNARVRVGRQGEQVAIALLAPAAEATRAWNPSRSRARQVAAFLAHDFANAIPGRVAKYDDTFNPRAFGDLMQAWGTSTVLIESGGLPGDPQKQRLRTLNAAAILGALETIATGSYRTADPDWYEGLPYNTGGAYDLLVRGGTLMVPGLAPLRADVAINFDDAVARTGPRLREVGDLETAEAIDTVDASGLYLHADPAILTSRPLRAGGPVGTWLRIGEPTGFVIRSGPEGSSTKMGTVP